MGPVQLKRWRRRQGLWPAGLTFPLSPKIHCTLPTFLHLSQNSGALAMHVSAVVWRQPFLSFVKSYRMLLRCAAAGDKSSQPMQCAAGHDLDCLHAPACTSTVVPGADACR